MIVTFVVIIPLADEAGNRGGICLAGNGVGDKEAANGIFQCPIIVIGIV